MHVIWIHGWGMSPEVWSLAGISSYWPGINHMYFTYAGCHTMGQASRRLIQQIERLPNGAPLHLVGWSLGGMLAVEAAAVPRLAGRLKSLVLIGSTLRFASGDRRLGWPPRILGRMRQGLRASAVDTLREFAQSMFTAGELNRPEVRSLLQRATGCGSPPMTDFSPAALEDGLIYLRDTDLSQLWLNPALAALPTLWIHGGKDTVCPLAAVPEIPTWRGRKRVLPDAGHAPFLSESAAVLGEMKEFWHEQQHG